MQNAEIIKKHNSKKTSAKVTTETVSANNQA